MINQSTNNLTKLLEELTKDSKFYYVEQKGISSCEELDGHTIYSHFKRINQPINSLLLKQHINKEQNIAISIKNRNFLLFEYSGEFAYAFGALLYKLAEHEGIDNIYIIEYSLDKLIICLAPKSIDFNTLVNIGNRISEKILLKLPLAWRVLPNSDRPDSGNLLILPREYINPPWK